MSLIYLIYSKHKQCRLISFTFLHLYVFFPDFITYCTYKITLCSIMSYISYLFAMQQFRAEPQCKYKISASLAVQK